MDGKIQILKRLELFLEFVSLWVLYINQEFGCTGLLILCTILPSLDSLSQEIRFLLLSKFLHFQDNQHPGYDPNDPYKDRLFKIRDIMNMLKEKFNTVYYPPEQITVDDSLICSKEGSFSNNT